MIDDEEEQRYEAARGAFSGLVGRSYSRERAWMALSAALVLAFICSEWRHSSQLASYRVEKSHGFVVVVDRETGERMNVQPVSAAEFRATDGMVRHRLVETIMCIRGLDGSPKLVASCWKKAAPLFAGELAVKKFEEFHRSRFPSTAAILRQQETETIEVEVVDGLKPDEQLPDRWWFRWKEIHRTRAIGSKDRVEMWSGTFDTQRVELSDDPASTGMRIEQWQWAKDLKQGDG